MRETAKIGRTRRRLEKTLARQLRRRDARLEMKSKEPRRSDS